jgi:hypothetical protein
MPRAPAKRRRAPKVRPLKSETDEQLLAAVDRLRARAQARDFHSIVFVTLDHDGRALVGWSFPREMTLAEVLGALEIAKNDLLHTARD